jgi:hypothetical protein|tara:strand:- start:185 stop:415 length:231 start_codon:yes stop_codon:yes gene_type:complete
MSKMFLLICVVWISGPKADGGITKCMMHVSKVEYRTKVECKADLNNSKNLVMRRLEKEFGDAPDHYIVQASCLRGA